jgi:hypothetical protein
MLRSRTRGSVHRRLVATQRPKSGALLAPVRSHATGVAWAKRHARPAGSRGGRTGRPSAEGESTSGSTGTERPTKLPGASFEDALPPVRESARSSVNTYSVVSRWLMVIA